MRDRITFFKNAGLPERAQAFADGYGNGQLRGACTTLIDELKNEAQREYVSPLEIASAYGLVGDRNHTFEWLEKGYAERSGRMEYVKTDYFFDSIRSDPRYASLLRRMRFP